MPHFGFFVECIVFVTEVCLSVAVTNMTQFFIIDSVVSLYTHGSGKVVGLESMSMSFNGKWVSHVSIF